MKINGRGKLGIEDARSKVARNACDIQRVSGKCSPGTSEQQFFFPNNLECSFQSAWNTIKEARSWLVIALKQ